MPFLTKRHLTRVPSRLRVTLAMVRGELKGVPINAVETFFKSDMFRPPWPKTSSCLSAGAQIPQLEFSRLLESSERTVQLNSAEPPSMTVVLLGIWPSIWPEVRRNHPHSTHQGEHLKRSYIIHLPETQQTPIASRLKMVRSMVYCLILSQARTKALKYYI